MRLLIALLALSSLTAGCAFLEEGATSSSTSLFSPCPQWVPGLGTFSAHIALRGGEVVAERLVAPSGLALDGLPLDLVSIRVTNVTTTNAIAVRAFLDANGTMGTQTGIRSHRGDDPAQVPVLSFSTAADTLREFDVLLSQAPHGSTPRPAPLWLTLTNEGSSTAFIDFEASFLYRVCGV
mgnify:CR=1 FL=1